MGMLTMTQLPALCMAICNVLLAHEFGIHPVVLEKGYQSSLDLNLDLDDKKMLHCARYAFLYS